MMYAASIAEDAVFAGGPEDNVIAAAAVEDIGAVIPAEKIMEGRAGEVLDGQQSIAACVTTVGLVMQQIDYYACAEPS